MIKISSALISVYYKDGLESLAKTLVANGVTIYSTGGTQQYLLQLGITCIGVEEVTNYPSILGGRVKTLHPKIFGGMLYRRNNEQDIAELQQYAIPAIDLVIVDLYPFEKTLKATADEASIIEKIDIGGPSMIRAAAKNYSHVVSIACKDEYETLSNLLCNQGGATTLEQRKAFAAKAFNVVMHYDVAINNYFDPTNVYPVLNPSSQKVLRYGENPHQNSTYYGDLEALFAQHNGKQLSYNNLVDVQAAVELLADIEMLLPNETPFFAIIKHTNTCGAATASTTLAAWQTALACDPESAFGGVLITNHVITAPVADAIKDIFFEVLVAPDYDDDALAILRSKKNRILLQQLQTYKPVMQYKSMLTGILVQQADNSNYITYTQVGGRNTTNTEDADLQLANVLCKHLKSNAIAIVKNGQLIGKGCGQTSRVDALKQALEKARQFNVSLTGAVLASDGFFPFGDCVQLAHQAGITAYIQPGGSIRDKDSIDYCVQHNLAMVLTQTRHFKH